LCLPRRCGSCNNCQRRPRGFRRHRKSGFLEEQGEAKSSAEAVRLHPRCLRMCLARSRCDRGRLLCRGPRM
jgi:hypothetical protein